MAYSDTGLGFTQFEARQLPPAIGAELIGADLTSPTAFPAYRLRARQEEFLAF